MITLFDIKSYLKIDQNGTEYNSILESCINSARSRIENYCNRNFQYKIYTEYQDGNGLNTLYVNGYPVKSVTTLQYYDTTDYTYKDIIDGSGDTISNALAIKNDKLVLRRSYSFPLNELEPDNIKIVYTAGYKCLTGTGIISITIATKTVTGVNTLFTTELEVGDKIQCEGQLLEVATITNNTSLTVLDNASSSISGKNYRIKTLPSDLEQVALEMTALSFYDSPQGKGRLGISSENVGAQATQSFTFKEVEWNKILDKYLNMNI